MTHKPHIRPKRRSPVQQRHEVLAALPTAATAPFWFPMPMKCNGSCLQAIGCQCGQLADGQPTVVR